MNVMEAIKTRRSVRSYQDKPVEPEKLQQVLEAARLAPSASNQDWKFIVVQDTGTRQALAKACHNQAFIGQAPVVIAACSTNPSQLMPSGQSTAAVDLAIAVDHMTLAAVELGLGTCWIGAFDAPAVGKLLDVPDDCAVVHVLPLGYPAESPPARPRKSASEIVCNEKFS
ncbi:MAG: nitroreductase family protein [Phycisphaerae bacterium]|nr:nitroreductase family protein [Phycisphaerae bacterium]